MVSLLISSLLLIWLAVKNLEKSKLIQLNITDQIKREIATLKLLKHPNVVRLHKILEKSKLIQININDQIKREIAILKLLKHPNVVRLHEDALTGLDIGSAVWCSGLDKRRSPMFRTDL